MSRLHPLSIAVGFLIGATTAAVAILAAGGQGVMQEPDNERSPTNVRNSSNLTGTDSGAHESHSQSSSDSLTRDSLGMTKEDWVKRITELESQLPPAVEDGASWEKRLRRVVGATVSGSALVAWIEVCRAHGYPQPPPDMEGRWRICVQWASSIGDAPSVKIAELRTQANMRELARAAFAGDDLQGMKIELALMQWDGAMDRGIWDSWSLINSFTTSVTAPRP